MLQVDNIVKTFGGTVALRGVSLEVQPGQFHTLLGENGAGKSTLVKIIGGVYAPDKGTIRWKGEPLGTPSPSHSRRLGIGIVHQDSALLPDLSVVANFALGREPLKGPGWVDWNTARAALRTEAERFKVDIDADAPVRSLSVGQRKLLDIMRVLQDAQKLIVLDEPTAAFTVEDTRRLMEILWEIKRTGTAIIYVTHRLQEIEQIVDRVTVLKDGSTVGSLSPEEATPGRIVSLMVGRELGDMYPPPPISTTGDALLQIEGFTRTPAFHDVNLGVRSGEIVALVGLAGHGAFEVAHSIYGDPPVTSGRLLLHGIQRVIDQPATALKAGIGFVAEDRAENVLKVLSVRDNLSLAALPLWSRLGWINTAVERVRAGTLVQSLNIKARGIRSAAESLSGGNQQKVVLGRWLAAETKLLVLVDPTAGVDVGARAEIYKLLRALADEGRGVLIATSDMAEALGLADRVYAFYKGTVATEFSRHDRREADILAAITGHAAGATEAERMLEAIGAIEEGGEQSSTREHLGTSREVPAVAGRAVEKSKIQ